MLRESRWQTRPVFVTSTFRDMHAERDWLRDRVIPELEERLRKRRAQLEVVDLRWGVETVKAGQEEADEHKREQAKEMIVLKVCLEEIKRCRPFLIVLLGDRYGWVPAPERMKAAVDEAGFEADIEGKSVTALEIEFGVLASPEQRRRTRFYFREPLPYDRMLPEVAAQFSEQHSPQPGAAEAQDRLEALKARIETDPDWRDRVRHYSATWDEAAGRVAGLEQFGAMVLEDVWADLEAEIPPLAEQAEVTWEDEEREAFEEFVADRDRDFRGRVEITDELVQFAMGEVGDCALSLTGGPGSGKSALLAHVYRKLEDRKALLLAHAAGISPRSISVDGLLLRFIEELAGFLGEAVPVREGASAEEIEQAFASLLGRAALRTRVVVLVDALNQFAPTPRAQHLTWLPKRWPENARLITTAIPCSASESLEQRDGVRARDLPALTTPEARDIAEAVCARYHRTLNPDVLQVLLDKRDRKGKPSSGNPLWLELALEALNLLDQDDFERLGTGEFTGTADEKLLQLLLKVARDLPKDIEGLYGKLLEESEETWGEAWAREFACLIAVSRGGWRESDFEKLLPARTGEAWDPLRFAGLRRSFRAHLTQRGPQRQWGFFHAQAREAVRRRYLTDPAHERELHAALADYLQALPRDDPLHESELMFHLIGVDDKPRAALYYGGELTEGELAGATTRLAEHIIATAGDETGPGLEWALEVLAQEDLPQEQVGLMCKRFVSDLHDALENETRLGLRLTLLLGTRETVEDLAATDPNNATWQRGLSASHIKIGDVREAQGDLAGAMQAHEASLQIRERLAQSDLGNAGWQRDLSVSHIKIGDVRVAQGDMAEALEAYGASYDIFERLAASDPGNTERQRDLSVSHGRIGDVRGARGDLAGALQAYEASLAIAECLAASDPGNTEWQRDLSVSYDRIGDVLRAQGKLSGALQAYEASLEIRERLVASDPTNAGWQRDLSVSYSKIGDVRQAQHDWAGALQAYLASLETRERLAASDPGNAGWQRDLAAISLRLGRVRRSGADVDGGLPLHHLDRARITVREMLRRRMFVDGRAKLEMWWLTNWSLLLGSMMILLGWVLWHWRRGSEPELAPVVGGALMALGSYRVVRTILGR